MAYYFIDIIFVDAVITIFDVRIWKIDVGTLFRLAQIGSRIEQHNARDEFYEICRK